MGHNWGLDYEQWAKNSFLLGLTLVVLGAVVAGVGQAVFGPLPSWERTLAIDMMILGIGMGFVGVFGFGILFPLTE